MGNTGGDIFKIKKIKKNMSKDNPFKKCPFCKKDIIPSWEFCDSKKCRDLKKEERRKKQKRKYNEMKKKSSQAKNIIK